MRVYNLERVSKIIRNEARIWSLSEVSNVLPSVFPNENHLLHRQSTYYDRLRGNLLRCSRF
jgi:hypothetical protein